MIMKEKTISSDRIYTGKIVSLKVDTVEVENKGYKKREIIEHNGVVAILSIINKRELILVKRFRKATQKVLWEIPSTNLEICETPKECAIRELKEKIGYNTENIKLIHQLFSTPDFSNHKVYIYLANDLVEIVSQYNQEYENIKIYKIDIDEAYNMVLSNEIEDSKTIIAILFAKNLLY